jgi:hypothetical protein
MLAIYYVFGIGGLVIILSGSSWFLIFLYKPVLKKVPISTSLKRPDFKIWIIISL